jgi:hypothetical protein
MFVHHLAYRYENGDVEEFVGFGLTPSSAHQNSVNCAKAVVLATRSETFTMARIDDDAERRTTRERSQINAAIKTRSYLAALL